MVSYLYCRLVYDRETGKPKGYGFCEYRDQDTAMSAMRNLNGFELNGRTLRVDNAANERTREEFRSLQTSERGSFESPYGPDVDPEKAPEAISKAVASLPPEQMFELAKQMKQCIQTNPTEARNMLLQNPQLAYAILQALVLMRVVDPAVATSILFRPNAIPAPLHPQMQPMQHIQQPLHQPPMPMAMQPQQHQQPHHQEMPPQHHSQWMPPADFNRHGGPPMPQLATQMPPQGGPMDPRMARQAAQFDPRRDPRAGGGGPSQQGPPPQGRPGPLGNQSPMQLQQDQEKQALIMQVLQLSDEQIAVLPPDQRNSILLLKSQIARGTP